MEISATDERFMRLAIDTARQGVEQGQSPFGACIVKGADVVSCAHNVVWATTDSDATAWPQPRRGLWDCLRDENLRLFERWRKRGDSGVY